MIVFAVSLLSVVTLSAVILSRKPCIDPCAKQHESANALFHRLAEQTRTVHWEVDAEGLYTHVSDISEAVIGYRPEDLIGKKHFYDLHRRRGAKRSRRRRSKRSPAKSISATWRTPYETRDGRLILGVDQRNSISGQQRQACRIPRLRHRHHGAQAGGGGAIRGRITAADHSPSSCGRGSRAGPGCGSRHRGTAARGHARTRSRPPSGRCRNAALRSSGR